MKQVKRILALTGAIVLASLYLITLIMAVTDSSQTMNMFKASIAATVFVPFLIWAYSFIYGIIRRSSKDRFEKLKEESASDDDDAAEKS